MGEPLPEGGGGNSYDAVPYSVNAFAQTHPNRLSVMAALFGLAAAMPERCRVLELGCASGGNLIPMALAHQASQFVGVDLSQHQVTQGREAMHTLGITNLDLQHKSIMDVGPDDGMFDFILAHGVYSWVPPAVQEKILGICRENLAPSGVAYVSYNTYPGWHARGAIREMLWYHTERFTEPRERIRQARALIAFLAASVPAQDIGYSALMRQELALLLRTPDSYLLHEHLEEFNEPLYFHQFASRAMAAGLQYLGEAQISAMVASRLGADVEKILRDLSPDLLHMEQYMDFVRNRMFRQTLLCHAEVKLEHALRPLAVTGFYIASAAQGEGVNPVTQDAARFVMEGKPTLTTQDALMKGAMVELAERWPMAMHYEALVDAAWSRVERAGGQVEASSREHLPQRLLNCYASGLVEFSVSPTECVATVSEKPVASAYARLLAEQGERVCNLRLETVTLTEASRLVVTHLDGKHDRGQLIELVAAWLAKQPANAEGAAEAPRDRAAKYVEHLMPVLARHALLTA